MANISKEDYILGVNEYELDRLRFQHGVWKSVTDGFFDRLGIKKGMKILDAGSGPGFASFDLLERTGVTGEVTALEPSEMYLNYFKQECEKRKIKNVKFINGTAETAKIPENYFDIIYSRWVIGFVPDPDLFIEKLAASLAPGGVIAIEDYAFNRLLLYPTGGDYEKVSLAVMEFWKLNGGDLCIAARIPAIFKKLGIKLIDFHPNCIAGGPDTGIFEWHHRFITQHVPAMVEKNLLSKETGDAILKDWENHRSNPEAVFFSPLVVDVAGRKG
jgi:ubiquinone/menaquinone biosynthesis C-methylase UbiE